MPSKKPTPAPLPSDDLILAAIERAERHRVHKAPGEPLSAIAAHLELPFHSGTSKRLRPRLRLLEERGLIEPLRRLGKEVWTPTPAGTKHLAIRRRVDALPALPEAPQHRTWRQAKAAAKERIEDLSSETRTTLDEALSLLDQPEANSHSWYEMGKALCRATSHLASATYCLREWLEPDDELPDQDDAPASMRGRRAYFYWS